MNTVNTPAKRHQGVHLEIPIHPAMNMVFYALPLGILVVSRTEKRNDRNHVRVTYNIHRWILNTGNFFVRRLYKDAKIRHIPQILILILKKIQASCNLPAILYTIQAGGRFCPRMGIPARTARSESIRMPGHTKRKEVFLWSKRWWCSVGGDVWKRLGIPNCHPLFFGVLSSEIADFVSRHD